MLGVSLYFNNCQKSNFPRLTAVEVGFQDISESLAVKTEH